MSLVIFGIALFYVFYKLVSMDDSGSPGDDDFYDFITMRDASSIAHGDDPFDSNAMF